MNVKDIAKQARRSAAELVIAPTERKNHALQLMGEKLTRRSDEVLSANADDLRRAEADGLEQKLVQRLSFGENKIASRVRSLEKIRALADPVGQPFAASRRPNGLDVQRVRVPLGVILMIYEARPHVTVNAGAFCLKSGNAAILRGGSEARKCNEFLGELWRESLQEADLPESAVQVVSGSHEEIGELLTLDDYVDLVIPRGGKGLIRSVAEKSRIPVIKHFEGVCHVYADDGADVQKAMKVAIDSKCLMPEVCNAAETMLVAEGLSDRVGDIVKTFGKHGVTVRGCERTRELADGVEPADEDDWRTEYLDMVISLRVVKDVAEAIEHINEYGSHHTDTIVTDSESRARKFLAEVDSGVVLVNASTMFCDGESLGMGAEIGISTDKLHARGPMGLEELTTYKFNIRGDGHVMGDLA
ncbi:MAG: glutamate-5-semialdehyde dehydrogenase [Planctomycetota bacterium]